MEKKIIKPQEIIEEEQKKPEENENVTVTVKEIKRQTTQASANFDEEYVSPRGDFSARDAAPVGSIPATRPIQNQDEQ